MVTTSSSGALEALDSRCQQKLLRLQSRSDLGPDSALKLEFPWTSSTSVESCTQLRHKSSNMTLMSYDEVTPLISATVNNKVASAWGTHDHSR